jgi:2-methylisocitrate lyase-like PEP mutase family enzyme
MRTRQPETGVINKEEQIKKAELLRALHHAEAPLVLPNIWDAGSAVLAANAGFPVIATASASVAWALGRPDGEKLDRAEMLQVIARIATRVRLPLTADIESGYGTTPADVAETVSKTLKAGAVGINLEDGISYATGTVFPMPAAIERITAARTAAKEAGIDLVINARTDVYFGEQRSIPEKLDEAVARANAYLSAGADCAFVIAVRDTAAIAELVREIHGPVNIIAGSPTLDINTLARLGVKRISLAGGLARKVLGGFKDALEEIRDNGTTGFLSEGPSHSELNRLYGDSD